MVIRTTTLFFCLFLLGTTLFGQKTTEEEIGREKALIEANREKLLGNYDNAITILKDLHRQMSDNAAIAFELGRLYMATEDTESAVKFLKMATELDASNEWYPKFLSDIYQYEGRNEDGAALQELLIERDPDNPDHYFKQAFFLVRNREIEEAIEVYETLEKRQGLTEELARRKHTLYVGTGDIKKAARVLEELIATFPAVIDYRHLLASFHETQGNQQAAHKIYSEILHLNPDDAKAQLALSGGSAQNDEANYLASLRSAFERNDADIDQKISKIFPFIAKVTETGDQALANEVLALTSILENVHSGNAKGFAASGDLLYSSGRPKQAIEKYKLAIDRDKSVFPIRQQMLQAIYEIGDYEDLFDEANTTLDLYPNKAIAQYYLALASNGLQEYDDALDALSLAEIMAGRDNNLLAEVKALQGQIYTSTGNKAKSENAFTEAMRLSPNAPEVNYRYALFMLQSGNNTKALEHALLAAQTVPYQPYYAAGVANAYFVADNFAKAEEAMLNALSNSGNAHPEFLEFAGDIQFRLKNIEQAVQYWQEARQITGPSPSLDQKITNRSL